MSARRNKNPLRLYSLLAAVLLLNFLALPLVALVLSVPWDTALTSLAHDSHTDALVLSLLVSTLALLLSVLLGTPLAWILARHRFPGLSIVRALITLPMILPPVVAGVALLMTFGRQGILGGWLESLGLHFVGQSSAAILAAIFVSAPFFVLTLESAFRRVDPTFEQAAATLGANEMRRFFTIVLPAVRPAMMAGVALCWTRALGEFGATITFAGNLRGQTQTIPLAVYEALQSDMGYALLLSLLLLLVSLTVLILINHRRVLP